MQRLSWTQLPLARQAWVGHCKTWKIPIIRWPRTHSYPALLDLSLNLFCSIQTPRACSNSTKLGHHHWLAGGQDEQLNLISILMMTSPSSLIDNKPGRENLGTCGPHKSQALDSASHLTTLWLEPAPEEWGDPPKHPVTHSHSLPSIQKILEGCHYLIC